MSRPPSPELPPHHSPQRPVLVTGQGLPVTVVAHGLGASLTETRPIASGVAGTKVFYAARGHTPGVPVGPVDYQVLGADLGEVADRHGATRAIGVSMGAGAALSALSRQPDRFSKVVLFLLGALDRPRSDEAAGRLAGLADAIERQDLTAVRAAVAAELSADVPGVTRYLDLRAQFLLSAPGIASVLRALPAERPVSDRSALAAVTAEVLVIAQEHDPLHPSQLSRELAAVLPRARLVVFDEPGAMFRERARLRGLIVEFLDADGAG